MESTLEKQVITLDPEKIELPKEVSSTLELTATLTLQTDSVVEGLYYIFITDNLLIQRSVMYSSTDKNKAEQKYQEILDDFRKGNYKVETKISLRVFPETQLWADIP